MARVRLAGLIGLLMILSGLSVMGASAQAATCSAQELLSIARAGAACANLNAGTACYASGSVTSSEFPNVSSAGLTQLGDRASLNDLASVQVTPGSASDAPLNIAALLIPLSPDASDQVTALLIEDAALENAVAPLAELQVQATGTLHIRATPANNASVIATANLNSGLTANGRTHDNQWLRVIIPATGEVGWAAANLIKTKGNLSSLQVIDPSNQTTTPAFGEMSLNSGSGSACGGTIPAGLILQTPSTDFSDAVMLNINGTTIKLAGTAFVIGEEMSAALEMTVIDGTGELLVDSQVQIIPAGAQSSRTVADGTLAKASPYDAAQVSGLAPILNTLPRAFQVTPPQPQEVIDAQIAAVTQPLPTPVSTATSAPNECRLTIGRNTTVWSGPGQDYEALSSLDAGTPIHPVLETTDTLGATWWELADSQWIPKTVVVERGDCSALIVASVSQISAPPTNGYSLERCQSTNGPVRAGQQVTLEFVPPPWDNLGAAQAALQTDPGHFMINARRHWADASEPIRLGENTNPLEDRYLRQFTLIWTAQPGTYRITGDWLSYSPSCNLTVPVEQ